ncbi:hypothetical protein ACH5RR_030042 [Cinchona calisaya]|uniref:Uncharacterized protein n=1 Tax=Cinchona calisaya TaxID=153742 RepID=A0ABD2YVP2_9GENT
MNDYHEKLKYLEGLVIDVAYRTKDFIEELLFDSEMELKMMKIFNRVSNVDRRTLIGSVDFQKDDRNIVSKKNDNAIDESSRHISSWKTEVIDHDDDLLSVLDRLTMVPFGLNRVAFVGMGGIVRDEMYKKSSKQLPEDLYRSLKGKRIKKTNDRWNGITDSISAFLDTDPEQCMKVLALSYNNLPNLQKACFLYVGTFPEDCEIEA